MAADNAPQDSGDRFHWRDPGADRTTIHRMREALRGWLVGQGLPGEFGQDVVLAAYEAVANAVEHGNRDVPGSVTVTARAGADGMELSVRDDGRWRAGRMQRDDGRGNGLLLMRALSDDCVIAADGAGTTVTMSWRPETMRSVYRSAPGGR